MRFLSHVRDLRGRRPAALSAMVLVWAAVMVPLGPPAAAQPSAQSERIAAYDHSRDKGKPGTRGPLPAGFSRTHISVKFRADRAVRLRDGRAVAREGADTAAVQAVLAKYPAATMTRPSPQPEQAVDAERARLEAGTGRELPDLNSWFAIEVPTGIESLLDELNALPSVEIAIARPRVVAPVEPLQSTQVYRTSAAAGSGIDADFAHSLPGGKGEGITVTDVEAGGRDSAAQSFGSVASGDAHSLMVHKVGAGEVGTVRAWGLNSSGQLGTGNTTNATVFTQVSGLTDVVAVAAGGNFSMALKTNGTVWTWGANANGQLGNGTTTNSSVPVQVSGLTTVTSIAAGSNFAVAVLSDGTMRAWGANGSGQLGDATTTQRLTPVAVTGVTGVSTGLGSVAAGTSHTLALKSTGAVQAWGANAAGQLGRNPATTPSSSSALTVTGVSGATQVAAGGAASYARLTSGAVSSWGANGSGQLGNGSTTNSFTPANIAGLTSVAVVAAGGSSAATVHTDHSVRAWGLNSSGQLGIGSTANVSVPTTVSLPPGAVQLAAGATQMVAVGYNPGLETDPNSQTYIWAWGANGSGQLGTGNTTASTSPVLSANMRNLWNTCHEDLANRPAPAGPPVRLQVTTGSPCQPVGLHGTASVGFVAAQDDNGVGINGLLPKARLQLVNGDDWQGSVALARTNSQPGDVIWFEVAYGSWPWELSPEIYDEIVTATAAGITVVEPAANGGNSLDDPTDTWARMIMERPDSGAILVGAGEPSSNMPWTVECNPADPQPAPRTAREFSTYGTRVDVQGWANCITSLGGPDQHDLTPGETDPNKMYWSNMNGTSGASPMVVGAVGAVQGILKQSGAPLTPLQVRSLLKRTGSPQPAGDPRHIGPLPDIRAAIDDLRGGVAAGAGHTLSARADGTVWTWGDNASGQLGNGTTTASSSPVPVTRLGEVRRGSGSIAGGATHSLAVRADGTAWAWGQGTNGQLGNGGTANSSVPVQVSGLTGVVAVAAGTSFSAALKSDGTVWTWGLNTNGQLGDNTTTQRTTPVQAGTLNNVARISAGASHMLAVRTDGTAWAWGANSTGRLGLGDTVQRNAPTQITGLTGVSALPGAIAAGADHSLAVRADGTVAAWGGNTNGQLGLGDTTQRTSPTNIVPLTGVSAVSAGTSTSFAVRTNGTASGWGANTNGQVGDNTTTQRTTPVAVAGLTRSAGISAGSLHTVAVRPDGAVWAWGANASGQLGNGTTTGAGPASLTRINLARPRSNISTGASHALAADPSGRVLAWGANAGGQLGNGTTSAGATSSPVQVRGVSNAVTTPGGVAAGDAHSLAVIADGLVLAWGTNSSGQLGNNSTTASNYPVVVSGLSGVVAVAAGGNFSMALKSDGTVWTWGLNGNGQLGLGNTTNRLVPTQVTALTSVTSIGAGSTFAFAARSDGTVRSWGLNTNGQLGDGTTTQRTAPVTVSGLTGVSTRPGAVDGGSNHAVAVKADGTVVAWGSNNSGQLGSNPATVTSSSTAIAVSGLTAVARVGAGVQYSLAVRADGTARTWGSNSTGQLGNGSTTTSWPPVTPNGSLTALSAVTGGTGFSATSQANGTLWTWGTNGAGQLGNGTTTASTSPVVVAGT